MDDMSRPNAAARSRVPGTPPLTMRPGKTVPTPGRSDTLGGMKDSKLPASVLMGLGLAGCTMTNACLSVAHSGPCLSIAHTGDSDDCDTSDPEDTDCPEDTDVEQSREAVVKKVLEAGALPSDVADRVTE